VHPGEIVLKEDPGKAIALLQLINLVVERRISTQKRIEEMFGDLPPTLGPNELHPVPKTPS
jgi:hypothetical protein